MTLSLPAMEFHGYARVYISAQVTSSRGKVSKAVPMVRDDTERQQGRSLITPVRPLHLHFRRHACMHGTLAIMLCHTAPTSAIGSQRMPMARGSR